MAPVQTLPVLATAGFVRRNCSLPVLQQRLGPMLDALQFQQLVKKL